MICSCCFQSHPTSSTTCLFSFVRLWNRFTFSIARATTLTRYHFSHLVHQRHDSKWLRHNAHADVQMRSSHDSVLGVARDE
jgi:hypothetical protein